MCNCSLSWILTTLDTRLVGIPSYIWGILGLALTAYLGYPYVKKISRQNKIDLDQAKQDIIEAMPNL